MQEVHNRVELVWKIEVKVVKVLIMTFAYRSTCFTPLNMVYSELELEESMSELMTGHEVHGGGDLVWNRKEGS